MIKFLLRFFGSFFFGLSIVLVIAILLFSGIKDNLDNIDVIVDETVDEFFDAYADELLMENSAYVSNCVEQRLDICDAMEEEIKGEGEKLKEGMKDFDIPIPEVNFYIFYAVALLFFVIGGVFMYFGTSKVALRVVRNLALQVGIILVMCYWFLWKLLSIPIPDLMELFGVQVSVEGPFLFLIESFVDKIVYSVVRELILSMLVIGIIALVVFVGLLIYLRVKKN